MYLPKDIVDIIFFYKKQLELISLNEEFRMTVKYNYSSEFFSQIYFNKQSIAYYRGKDKLLCKITNHIVENNGIYTDTIITMIKQTSQNPKEFCPCLDLGAGGGICMLTASLSDEIFDGILNGDRLIRLINT